MNRVLDANCYSSCRRVCVWYGLRLAQGKTQLLGDPLSPRFWKGPYWNLSIVFLLSFPSCLHRPQIPRFWSVYPIQPPLVSVSSRATIPKSTRCWHDGRAWGNHIVLVPVLLANLKRPYLMNRPPAIGAIPFYPYLPGHLAGPILALCRSGPPSSCCRHGYPDLHAHSSRLPTSPQDESRIAPLSGLAPPRLRQPAWPPVPHESTMVHCGAIASRRSSLRPHTCRLPA